MFQFPFVLSPETASRRDSRWMERIDTKVPSTAAVPAGKTLSFLWASDKITPIGRIPAGSRGRSDVPWSIKYGPIHVVNVKLTADTWIHETPSCCRHTCVSYYYYTNATTAHHAAPPTRAENFTLEEYSSIGARRMRHLPGSAPGGHFAQSTCTNSTHPALWRMGREMSAVVYACHTEYIITRSDRNCKKKRCIRLYGLV